MKYATCFSLISLLTIAPLFAEEHPPLNAKVDTQPIQAEAGKALVSYADVLDQATPSVVTVYTSQIVTVGQVRTLPDFLRQFAQPVPQMEPNTGSTRERKEPLGVGSGVIISTDGYIVTNHHVVQGVRGRQADEIRVRLNDDSEYVATLVGSDSKTDVAVLKIDAEVSLPAITLADSELIRVGDIVFAIGNPLDVGLTATQGIVSATGRNRKGEILGPGSYENFIQTDASINLGNSGGALVDAWGRLIGINTAIVSGSGGSIGIGFAIPVNMVLNVASNLIERGEVPRGMLGLFPGDLTRDMADAFGLDSTRGALVNQVQEDSPAASAGVRHGDIIVKVDDVEIDSAAQLRLVVSQILPGTDVDLTLIRMGETLVLPVTLGSLNGKVSGGLVDTSPLKGVVLRAVDEAVRADFSIPAEVEGVFVAGVSSDSPFVDKLEAQMVILEVNGAAVDSADAIADQLVEGSQNRLYVWAKGTKGFIVFKL
ncbi:Do family serine endopeptidase [Coraliomargarita sp. SDUM461003]|uniref:Do family serine endopeptidase n=1 Tax=Thalassobacterium maritimum TaxID=3041265 RepID=A0ABU1AZE1_9BACT|nr:Do family serine endopeptidase [Coraliomargarita sp. SDUM461003]MDQ8209528.1 Do family serine endopeptidase [Coraliomargarita sp. SDUM461003]